MGQPSRHRAKYRPTGLDRVADHGRLPGLRVGLYLIALGATSLLATMVSGLVVIGVGGALPLQQVALLSGTGASGELLLGHGLFLLGIVLVTFLFRRLLDGRSFESLGFSRTSGWVAEGLLGFGLGTLLMSLILLSELARGAYWLRNPAWQQHPVWELLPGLGLAFVGFVVVAFVEELVARGYILQNLAVVLGRPAAALLSSLLFALGHLLNPGAGVAAVLGLFFAGLLLAAGLIASGRLWLPMGLHLAWNLCQGPLFGFPVSGISTASLLALEPVGTEALTGGPFGPEASLVGVLAELLGIVLIWAWQQQQSRRPDGGSALDIMRPRNPA